jgi:hypothetical protein
MQTFRGEAAGIDNTDLVRFILLVCVLTNIEATPHPTDRVRETECYYSFAKYILTFTAKKGLY